MKVVVMRHGDAVFCNADRVLSAQGKNEVKMTGLKLVVGLNFTKIFSSPKQRALQTASIVSGLVKGKERPQVEIFNELAPCGNPNLVRDYLEATCTIDDTILLVSHIPQVLNLCYSLCNRELALPMFTTASALVLEQSATHVDFYPTLFYTPYGETKLDRLALHKPDSGLVGSTISSLMFAFATGNSAPAHSSMGAM